MKGYLYLKTSKGERIYLDKGGLRIGRRSNNELVLSDPHVSKHHARIAWQDRRMVLVDNKSANGTFVNGKRVRGHAVLHPDDVITIGNQSFKFKYSKKLKRGESAAAGAYPHQGKEAAPRKPAANKSNAPAIAAGAVAVFLVIIIAAISMTSTGRSGSPVISGYNPPGAQSNSSPSSSNGSQSSGQSSSSKPASTRDPVDDAIQDTLTEINQNSGLSDDLRFFASTAEEISDLLSPIDKANGILDIVADIEDFSFMGINGWDTLVEGLNWAAPGTGSTLNAVISGLRDLKNLRRDLSGMRTLETAADAINAFKRKNSRPNLSALQSALPAAGQALSNLDSYFNDIRSEISSIRSDISSVTGAINSGISLLPGGMKNDAGKLASALGSLTGPFDDILDDISSISNPLDQSRTTLADIADAADVHVPSGSNSSSSSSSSSSPGSSSSGSSTSSCTGVSRSNNINVRSSPDESTNQNIIRCCIASGEKAIFYKTNASLTWGYMESATGKVGWVKLINFRVDIDKCGLPVVN